MLGKFNTIRNAKRIAALTGEEESLNSRGNLAKILAKE